MSKTLNYLFAITVSFSVLVNMFSGNLYYTHYENIVLLLLSYIILNCGG